MQDKKELLISYIKANIAPVLVDFIFGKDLDDVVILDAFIDSKELTGHYENINYVCPSWFNNLINGKKILVIDKIDTISKEEQLKFLEILKYRKISTFELPEDVRIIVTANKISMDIISEEILSLVARI